MRSKKMCVRGIKKNGTAASEFSHRSVSYEQLSTADRATVEKSVSNCINGRIAIRGIVNWIAHRSKQFFHAYHFNSGIRSLVLVKQACCQLWTHSTPMNPAPTMSTDLPKSERAWNFRTMHMRLTLAEKIDMIEAIELFGRMEKHNFLNTYIGFKCYANFMQPRS